MGKEQWRHLSHVETAEKTNNPGKLKESHMEDEIFAIDRALRRLEEEKELTLGDAFDGVHEIVAMIGEVVSRLSLSDDHEKVASQYRKAEKAYLLAAEKVADDEKAELLLSSTYWLMMAHQAEQGGRPRPENVSALKPSRREV